MGWRDWFGIGKRQAEKPAAAPLPRIAAEDNPLGIPLLDLRPVTGSLIAMSSNPEMATNAASYGSEDGLSFVGQDPGPERVDASLRYPIDGMLADGVLFNPPDMDHKWALYVHSGKLLVVRSWQRKVQATADLRREEGAVVIEQIAGTLGSGDPEWTVQAIDFLVRSHALGEVWPIPDPVPDGADEQQFATVAFSLFGRKAVVAAFGPVPYKPPSRPLRTCSLLHIAVARADREALRAEVARGVPVDLRASDGLVPLQWALAAPGTAMLEELLALGAAIDGRSDEGATPLMQACQGAERDDAVQLLLERGANPNARDHRGFTALHRAAEGGRSVAVRLLLAAGADRSLEAAGYTALSLAELRGQTEIAAMLRG